MEQSVKYTFRTLNSTDIFPVIRIVRKIGLNKFKSIFDNPEMQAMMNEQQEEMTAEGSLVFMLDIMQIVLDGVGDCENDIFELLARVSDKTADEIKSFDMVTFTEMLMDFFKKEELKDFLRAVFTALKALMK